MERRRQGKISVTSPLARALIGKTKGATVEVEAPGGDKVYQVQHVKWPDGSPQKRKR
jgi:transcription elongation factor GreA